MIKKKVIYENVPTLQVKTRVPRNIEFTKVSSKENIFYCGLKSEFFSDY